LFVRQSTVAVVKGRFEIVFEEAAEGDHVTGRLAELIDDRVVADDTPGLGTPGHCDRSTAKTIDRRNHPVRP
jgi:hypothetical protein